MSRTNNPNLNNTNADTAVEIGVRSIEFKNVDQGGVIGGGVGSRLYLSENGEVRLVQKNILFQQAAKLYDFDKGEWTPLGEDLVPDENDRTNLLNATKRELQQEIARRKKSNPNQKDVTIGADSIINAKGEETKDDQEPDKKDDEEKDGNGGLPFASIEDLQSEFKKLQKTDSILQRLSLRNLKYPLDADYGNTQDYIQINQFTYQAVNPSIIFPQQNEGEGAFQAGSRQATNTIFNGLDRGSPKNIPIGLVKLPMPNQLNDSNNVAWGEDQLNALTAAAATLGAGGLQQGIDFFEDIASGEIKGPLDAIGRILSGAGDSAKGLIGFLNEAAANKNSNLLARSVVGSSLLNLAGFGLSPEAILARGAGVIPNANLELLFNAPALRAFRFDWKMSPRSHEESIRINNIIRFFKQGMAAKKMSIDGSASNYFLGTPNVFDIAFKTSKTNREITNTNHSVLKIKTCACVGAAVNYTPQGMWNAYEKGQPTSCILSLQFKELEPIYSTDYEEDPFEYDNLIGAVPADAVGY
jgi:hypothetical protein